MAIIAAEADKSVADADDPGGQWQPYLGQMAPNTRIYVKDIVDAAIAAGSEFGRGVFGSDTNLQLIADMSQIDDDLGTFYAETFKHAAAKDMKHLENPKIVEAARENLADVKNLLAEIKAGNTERISEYVRALNLYD